MSLERRRVEDQNLKGWRAVTCWCAQRASEFWDWVDKRDIDKHFAAIGIIVFMLERTIVLIAWAREIASAWIAINQAGHAVPGSDVALVIGAILAPWSLVLGAVLPVTLGLYFKARPS